MDRQGKFWGRLKLNRDCAVTLSAQLADAVREAVDDGILKPGDVLPSQLELAARLGTSARVPREAFAALAAERIAVARPRIGCVVLPRRASAKRGRILFVVRESMAIGYYVTVFENALRSLFVRKGFTFVKAVLGSDHGGRGEYTELEDALSHPNVLGIAFDDEEETFKRIRAAGVPVVAIGIRNHRGITGLEEVGFDVAGAIPDFVAHCRRAGVRSVTQFSFGTSIDAVPRLQAEGIRAEGVVLGPVRARSAQEGIQRAGLEAVLRRYGGDFRRNLPDVLLFTDDYLAAGALLALAHLGIRIPTDVRATVFSNVGSGPVHPLALTRMEMDPEADARKVFGWLRQVLAGRPLPSDAALRPRYIRAASFA